MLAKWTKTCTLYFAAAEGGSASNMNIDHAELDGEVNIDHPQLKLRSDQLDLAFNSAKKPTTNPSTMPTVAAGGAMQAKLDSVQASIGVLDLKILDASAKSPIAGKLEAVAAAATDLETKLAAESKNLKDINDAGKIPALGIADPARRNAESLHGRPGESGSHSEAGDRGSGTAIGTRQAGQAPG